MKLTLAIAGFAAVIAAGLTQAVPVTIPAVKESGETLAARDTFAAVVNTVGQPRAHQLAQRGTLINDLHAKYELGPVNKIAQELKEVDEANILPPEDFKNLLSGSNEQGQTSASWWHSLRGYVKKLQPEERDKMQSEAAARLHNLEQLYSDETRRKGKFLDESWFKRVLQPSEVLRLAALNTHLGYLHKENKSIGRVYGALSKKK